MWPLHPSYSSTFPHPHPSSLVSCIGALFNVAFVPILPTYLTPSSYASMKTCIGTLLNVAFHPSHLPYPTLLCIYGDVYWDAIECGLAPNHPPIPTPHVSLVLCIGALLDVAFAPIKHEPPLNVFRMLFKLLFSFHSHSIQSDFFISK